MERSMEISRPLLSPLQEGKNNTVLTLIYKFLTTTLAQNYLAHIVNKNILQSLTKAVSFTNMASLSLIITLIKLL